MLDLIKLEQKLDDALERETAESLLEWMNSRRIESLSNFVGEIYDYTQMSIIISEFSVKTQESKERYNTNMHNYIHSAEELLKAS